jgi:hypothetical protein
MKARILTGWILGIALAGATTACGLAQEGPKPPLSKISTDVAGTLPSAQGTNAASQSNPTAPVVLGKLDDKSPSLSPPLSTWSDEIQKLTRARVDEHVILAYITNSAGLFNLCPDHIIYLKKAGVSPRVITVMLQHDQTLLPSASPESGTLVPSANLAGASPASGEFQVLANNDSWASEYDYYAPEQPESAGPVRLPYAVKLNDPIVILKLPSFAVPYW